MSCFELVTAKPEEIVYRPMGRIGTVGHLKPMLPEWALPVVLDVSRPVGRFHQGRATPRNRAGKADTIARGAKANLLAHQRFAALTKAVRFYRDSDTW